MTNDQADLDSTNLDSANLAASASDPAVFDTAWHFPHFNDLPDSDLVAVGADLEPGTLIKAYQSGLFPMPLEEHQIGWFWPTKRGIFRQGDLVISRSLRRSVKRYTTTHNHAFEQVIAACSNPDRPHGWIDESITSAYIRLHQLGVAHSIEVWDGEVLAGGLYGISVGGLFAGESMFHRQTDASKVALVTLTEMLWSGPADTGSGILLDTQWATEHLSSLGAIEVGRPDYAKLLGRALQQPSPLPMTAPSMSTNTASQRNDPNHG